MIKEHPSIRYSICVQIYDMQYSYIGKNYITINFQEVMQNKNSIRVQKKSILHNLI